MKRIICFHLFNDYSGSPKVLSLVLKGMLEKGFIVDLISSSGGVLDELSKYPNFHKHSYPYRFSNNPLITMIRYAAVQLYTFFLSFRWLFCKDCIFYINTILPVAPALAGRLSGKRVIYHYHENAFIKGKFYRFLAMFMEKLAHRIICVSKYQASFLKRKEGVEIIPNALPPEFIAQLQPNINEAFQRKTVLMLSSLKDYKGTKEFIELSKKLPQYKFVLVINDNKENIDKYLINNNLSLTPPTNLMIYPRQNTVVEFYNTSTMVVVLTDPRKVIETFGLTTLEAMSCALPVIVPTMGGIAQMVQDGKNGYKTDVQNLTQIKLRINEMLSNQNLYSQIAHNCCISAKKYDVQKMYEAITGLFE